MPNTSHTHLRAYVALLVMLLLLIGIGYAIVTFFAPASTDMTQSYLQQAGNAFNANDFSASINDANAVLATDPNNVQALITKATALAQEGSITFQEQTYGPQAIAVAQQALAIDPQNADAWRIIGYANEIMQNYTAAEQAYEKSLSIDPQNAQTLSQQAHSYDLQGDLSEAETGYKAALVLDPMLDQAQLGLGRILMSQGDLSGALAQFEAAATSTQNVRIAAEAAYSSGVIESMQGNLAAAENSMSEATTSDPTYALGWTGAGSVFFSEALATSSSLTIDQRNDLITNSFKYFQQALQLNPDQSETLYLFGTDLSVVGQTSTAVQVLQEAEKAVPLDITLNAPQKTQMLAQIKAALSVATAQR